MRQFIFSGKNARWTILCLSVFLVFCSTQQETGGFVYRLSSTPVSLDPAHAADAPSSAVVQEIFDGLVAMDPQTGKVVPSIAERWEFSPDGKTWTFFLRHDVKFHHGRRLTAEDFRYSFERILNPKTRCPRTWVLEPLAGAKEFMAGSSPHISGLETPDSFTLVLRLQKPFVPFLAQLAMEIASVVPREEVERWGGEFGFHPCGSGPYILESFVPDVEIVLTANPDAGVEKPFIERIRYRVVPSDVVALEQYKSGQIDFLTGIPTGQAGAVKAEFPQEMHQWPILELRYLGFNMEKEILRDHPKLREAIFWAIDRKGISEIIYEGGVQPACGILPPGLLASQSDSGCWNRDLPKAKALMAEAGFPEGKGLPELVLLFNAKDIESRLWQFVKANLAEAGIPVQLKSLEWASYLDAVRKGECDMFRGSWVADYPDPHNFLHVLFYSQNSGAAGNYSRYSDSTYDLWVEEAQGVANDSIRFSLYRQAETKVMRDLPVCPLFFGGDAVLLKAGWEGFLPSAQGAWATSLNRLRKR